MTATTRARENGDLVRRLEGAAVNGGDDRPDQLGATDVCDDGLGRDAALGVSGRPAAGRGN